MESDADLSALSLPELLYLALLHPNTDGNSQGIEPSKSPRLATSTVLALILDLALHQHIRLKMKTNWLMMEKQVIYLSSKDLVTQNEVLDLMIVRLKNQKHDHSVQQWYIVLLLRCVTLYRCDHWCGNTWKELLFPQHPTEALMNCIRERLVSQSLILISSEGVMTLTSKGAAFRDQIKAIINNSSTAVTNMAEPRACILLMSALCVDEIISSLFPEESKQAATEKLNTAVGSLMNASNVLTDDARAIIGNINAFIAQKK